MAEEQKNVHKEQEARNFVGRNGEEYVRNLATNGEKAYFEGTIYKNGLPDLVFLSYMTSSAYPY